MDLLVALGTTIGYIASLVYLVLAVRGSSPTDDSYFDVSVFLIVGISLYTLIPQRCQLIYTSCSS